MCSLEVPWWNYSSLFQKLLQFLDCLSHKRTHSRFFFNCHHSQMYHLNYIWLSEHMNEYNSLNLYKHVWIHPILHCFLLSGWMLLVSAAFPLHNPTWGVWLAASGPFGEMLGFGEKRVRRDEGQMVRTDQYWITNTKQRLHKSSWIVVRNVWKSVIKTVLSQSTNIPMWSLKS